MSRVEYLDIDAFLNVVVDPERTDEVFKIQTTLLKNPNRHETIQGSLEACEASPELLALYEKKYNPDFPSTEWLLDCPEGSLGWAVGRHLFDNKIELDFKGLDTSIFYRSDMSLTTYMGIRTLRNHDVYHVVMGLGTSPLDEYSLFCVQLAQFRSPYHMVLLSSGMLHTIFYDSKNIPVLLDAMHRYYGIGQKCKFLPGFPFENHWKTDLSEVRGMLGISGLVERKIS